MGSVGSKARVTETDSGNDKVETDGKLTVAQDIAGIVLSTLEQAARFAPVPYLQEAAGLAVALFEMVQTTTDNKSSFKALANDACGLVYTATNVWKDREADNDGKAIPQDLMDHLKELLDTMNDVMAFAKSRASRGIFARFVSHKADVGQIQGFRARLKDALDRFGMQSHITVRDAVARIQDQQTAILAALQAHAPGESLQIAPSENTPPTLPHPSHSFTSFGNIVNNGEGTFNSINGNYVVNNSSTNTSSTNSRNITNISTTNSNNRYDLGGIGRANGNTRNMGMGSGPGRSTSAGRRKAEHQPGQRGRRRGMGATP
ncbi:NACHT-NTPase and P-loop NTPases N-terminal domain-containing protein [Pleurotus pulmonarius]